MKFKPLVPCRDCGEARVEAGKRCHNCEWRARTGGEPRQPRWQRNVQKAVGVDVTRAR